MLHCQQLKALCFSCATFHVCSSKTGVQPCWCTFFEFCGFAACMTFSCPCSHDSGRALSDPFSMTRLCCPLDSNIVCRHGSSACCHCLIASSCMSYHCSFACCLSWLSCCRLRHYTVCARPITVVYCTCAATSIVLIRCFRSIISCCAAGWLSQADWQQIVNAVTEGFAKLL